MAAKTTDTFEALQRAFRSGGRREILRPRRGCPYSRAMQLALAMARVRAGESVLWMELDGGVFITETPMTNARYQPRPPALSYVSDGHLWEPGGQPST